MSLSYFYGLTNLSSGIIRDQWTYNAATGLGLFTGNSGANLVSQPVSGNNFEDFSLFFTYNKQRSNFNTGAAYLFSNYSGNNGFSFGLDAGNFPFLKTSGESFSFSELNLGVKNCLCLQKSDNNFSLLRYDIPSAELIESQSLFVNPSTQLSGGNYTFGASSGFISGVNNFYGTVDQLLFLSERISKENCLTVFSGFSILPVTVTEFGNYYDVKSPEWIAPTGFGTGLRTFFQDYFTGSYQISVRGQGLAMDSEYNIRINFSGVVGGYDIRDYYAENQLGFCNTGQFFEMGDFGFRSTQPGIPSDFDIGGNFSIGPPVGDPFDPDEIYFTYDLSEVYEGVRYNNLLVRRAPTLAVRGGNSGYFSGFEMNGVFVPRHNSVVLGTFPTGRASDIGSEAIFDSVGGVFRGTNVNTGLPIYLNGTENTGFTFESGVIDIENYTETSADNVIYDRVSGLQILSSSNLNSTTGSYWAKTSFVATGEYPGDIFRIRESEFYETSNYHLYHKKGYWDSSSDPIFENLDENWS